jgi:alpha-L-rhamnosidase
VERLHNPVGIDVVKPRFSWELQHTARGQAQSAYQIIVTKDGAKEGSAAFWDSGRVASPQSSLVEYGGPGEPSDNTFFQRWRPGWFSRR